MEYGNVTGIDKPISRLVQGSMMLNAEEMEAGFALLDAVHELGCTTFDLAHIYAGGQAERVFGKWMEARGNRDEIVVLTKGAHHNADRRRVTPFDITADLHDSLARLRTDCIDLYLLHRDDPSVPVGPIVEVLNEHHIAGRIRAFGGSNWTAERVQEAVAYAEAHGLTPFAASSPNFSLAEQVEEPWAECVSISGPQGAEARAWYETSQMPLFTWSSLAQGFFSGRLSRENLEDVREDFPESCIRSYCYAQNFQRLDRVQTLAEEKGLSVPQIALAYVMNLPLNIYALIGCRSRVEFDANLEALRLKLTPGELDWLDLRREKR